MNNDYQGTMLQDFYEIVRNLQPELKEFERTDIAPLIDAAVMRNPYDEEELPMFRRVLDEIGQDDYVILCNYDSVPICLKDLFDETGTPVDLITYDECVHRAEDGLNVLLRFSTFDRYGYYLYLGAAWAIVKAEHPDWIYETHRFHRFLSPAEIKEIKESDFGTGCAQERSDNFCDFFYFCGTKEIKKGLLWSLPGAAKFLLFLLFLRDKKNLLD